jgi:hypothetical protein
LIESAEQSKSTRLGAICNAVSSLAAAVAVGNSAAVFGTVFLFENKLDAGEAIDATFCSSFGRRLAAQTLFSCAVIQLINKNRCIDNSTREEVVFPH